ncbi:MAG TPA: YciI family protein [Streptosporangiaceae bacterium]|jgi:predicted ribosomally synthesized peptide with SipW-like signal peptide|nr:YciI family protein [Streptosporangiaceae bacterium]
MKYLLLHYVVEETVADATEACIADGTLAAWHDEVSADGGFTLGAHLQPTKNAATVTTHDGELLVSDGPFTETKEQIAGFDIIECADLSEAIQKAGRHPTAARYGTIEVRPIAEQPA